MLFLIMKVLISPFPPASLFLLISLSSGLGLTIRVLGKAFTACNDSFTRRHFTFQFYESNVTWSLFKNQDAIQNITSV